MSNLGWYQAFTTFAKKVGGPINAIGIIATVGYGTGRGLEAGVKKVVKVVKQKTEKEKHKKEILVAIATKTNNKGLRIQRGDRIRILEQDRDAVLIEVISRKDNPFYVSLAFLKEVTGGK